MDNLHDCDDNRALMNNIDYCNDGSWHSETCDIHESKTLGDDIIDDLDSYMEDINDRLTISRMVSDSIIRGMVNAVSQEAADVVGAKELEVARLKEAFCCQKFDNSDIDAVITFRKREEVQLPEHGRESLGILNQAVKEQLDRLENCIANAEGPIFKEISTPDMTMSGRHHEQRLIMKNDLEEAFHCLSATLKDFCQQVNEIVYSPESCDEEWKVELDIRKEVEQKVFSTIVQGLQCEYEKQLWNVSNVLALNDRFKEISSLRHELDSIQKCFVGLEAGNLSSQGSVEMDHFHRKVLSGHGLPSAQRLDGNCDGEESKISLPENFETSSLKHMSKKDLYQHFMTLITERKRGHESTVQQMTDAIFALRRELLKERELIKERGPYGVFKMDKDFEILKKKIPEVIAKLDDIVKENEKLSQFCSYSRGTLGSLLLENCRLKDLLHGQKLEHSRDEENFLKLVGDLKCALRDENIKASISEEVCKCIMREMGILINSRSEDLEGRSKIMQDICEVNHEGVFYAGDVASKSDYEEFSCLQSSIIQQIYGILYQEAVGDMSIELTGLKDKCLKDNESLVFLQRKVSESENELTMKVKENKELKQQVLALENSIREKDKTLLEVKKQVDSYTLEVDKLNKALESSKDKLRKSDVEKARYISALDLKQTDLESMKKKDHERIKHMESLCHAIQSFSISFGDFEHRIKESIGWQDVRLENSAFQLHALLPKANVLRRTGFLYKERLEKKSTDLQKAEAEVDLLGDEVDALLSLLEKIYVALDHYSPILQHYPGIIEILKLVKRELSGETVKAV